MLRDYAMKYGYDEIPYQNFEKDLYNVRQELASSRIMDTDLENLEETLMEKCEVLAIDGKISLTQLKDILREHKTLCLTPFQLALLTGFSNPNKEGMLDCKAFCSKLVHWITERFSIDALRRKA